MLPCLQDVQLPDRWETQSTQKTGINKQNFAVVNASEKCGFESTAQR